MTNPKLHTVTEYLSRKTFFGPWRTRFTCPVCGATSTVKLNVDEQDWLWCPACQSRLHFPPPDIRG